MADIKWVDLSNIQYRKRKHDFDIKVTRGNNNYIQFLFANEGFNAIATESIYIEVSHPDSYFLYFKQYNKKPLNRWAHKIFRRKETSRIEFSNHASFGSDFDKWCDKKYKVFKDHDTNTFYIRLEEGKKVE